MQPLNLTTTLKRLAPSVYEIDFVHANNELKHLPGHGPQEFLITRGEENLRGNRLVVRTVERMVEIFGETIMSEMVVRTNRDFGAQLYEAGIIE